MQRTGYALKVIAYLVELTLHLFPSLPLSLRLIPPPPSLLAVRHAAAELVLAAGQAEDRPVSP